MNTFNLKQLDCVSPRQEIGAAGMDQRFCAGCPVAQELNVESVNRILRYEVLTHLPKQNFGWDDDLQKIRLHFNNNQSIDLFIFHCDEFIANFCSGQEFQLTVNQDWWKGTEYVFNSFLPIGDEYSGKEHRAYPDLKWYWG